MATSRELKQLLSEPNEALAVEHKSWLDLRDDDDKARIAKAAIALANHGGGSIVLGFTPDVSNGGTLNSLQRPECIERYTQDNLNAAINRYSDPSIHCKLQFAIHDLTRVEHAIVVVPGDSNVPVMCKRSREGIITQQRCYIRKPGPKSEEPHTAAEWNAVLEKCLLRRRESMLDAMRTIIQGRMLEPTTDLSANALSEYMTGSVQRWNELKSSLPANSQARIPKGHYELGFQLLDVPSAPSFSELKRRMDEARRVRLTGWGPFVELHRPPYESTVKNNGLETWLGASDGSRVTDDSAHVDFWRVTLDGKMFLLRGYDEDAVSTIESGTVFDVTLPVWRVGEALLFLSRFALEYDEDPNIRIIVRYSGLSGRQLTSVTGRRYISPGRASADESLELTTEATAFQIKDNLVEILHALLLPLYERFGFFELPQQLVQEEVTGLRGGRF